MEQGKRLIIDTDVVRSAGGEKAAEIRSINCRNVLNTILYTTHSIVLTEDIQVEWKKHTSIYSKKWLTRMFARKRVVCIRITDNELRLKIESIITNEKKCQAMLKDVHLIEAALVTDKRIISMDNNARNYFHEVTETITVLKQVAWVNPCKDDDSVIAWLTTGAEINKQHLLSHPDN